MTVTLCVTRSWCCLFSKTLTSPTPKSKRHQKTEVIYFVNDLDSAPPEWRIHDVQSTAKLPLEASHSESLLDLDSPSRTSSWARQTSLEQCTNASSFARTRRRNLPSHNPSGNSGLPKSTTIPRSHGGQYDASDTHSSPVRNRVHKSARHRCSCTPGSCHRSQAAHPSNDPRRSLGRPSTRAPPGDSPHRGHRNSHLHLSQRPDEDQATASLYVQEAAQAADGAWQQTIWRTAGTMRRKPDHRIPRTPQLRFSRRRK